MAMRELPKPRPTFVLARGAYDAPTERVTPGTPRAIGDFPAKLPQNRLGLARWLLNPRHPLTSRVIVNRYWAMFFGRGLVATLADFGNQGRLPSHPQLLDWLATTFVDSGWNVKALQKRIVLSATYRQDSRCSPELRERSGESAAGSRTQPAIVGRADSRCGIGCIRIARSPNRRAAGVTVSAGRRFVRAANTMSPAYQQSTGRDLYRRSPVFGVEADDAAAEHGGVRRAVARGVHGCPRADEYAAAGAGAAERCAICRGVARAGGADDRGRRR